MKIGIIMPFKNQERFIEQSVQSILDQDLDIGIRRQGDAQNEVTLIAIDDGSTDSSREKVTQLLVGCGVGLDLIVVENSLKPAWARNLALAKYKEYDLLAFLDSDDVWSPTHLSDSISEMEKTGCDLVYSDVSGILDDGTPANLTGVANPLYFSLEELERSNYIYISTVVMKAKCAESDRMARWAEPFPDWEYWHRLAKKYHVHHLPKVGADYRWKRATGPWTYYDGKDAIKCTSKIIEWREFNWGGRVDGWLTQNEMDALRELSRGKIVLELGAYKGKSTSVMAMDALTVYSIDTFMCDPDGQTQGANTILTAFTANTRRFLNVRFYVGKTSEVLPALAGMKADVVFIDAAHDYDSVLSDLKQSWPLLQVGGTLAMHDYFNDDFPGVRRAADVVLGGMTPERVDSLAIFKKETEEIDGIRKEYALIAPFAVRLPDGRPNPKSPPISWWDPIVKSMLSSGVEIFHVCSAKDPGVINGVKRVEDPTMDELEALVKGARFFVSVDTFLQHFASLHGLRGVVVWSQSDPAIFGYSDNINVYRSKEYFRQYQFQTWSQTTYMEEAFPLTADVILAVQKFLPAAETKVERAQEFDSFMFPQ